MPKTDVVCELIGKDGNIFYLMGIVRHDLKRAGHQDLAKEMTSRLEDCRSYDQALALIQEYVEVV
jgi:hypothetical protein